MFKLFIIFIFFIDLLIIYYYFDSIDKQLFITAVSVQTKSGPINGLKETFDGKEVNVFLGIPYAEPPIGNLRFRRPEPVKEWTQPLDANEWPNSCYQIENPFILNAKRKVLSEDCLYLNIWSPTLGSERDQNLKPIIVFISGEAFYIGSSSYEFFDAKVLSTLGDVVVVTFNYRLDAFGFFYADSDEAPGNVGLWDQTLALKWVNDNIEQFGGNPQNITLMGHSAGAWSVSLHILSPHSQHLFQNAILMSGAVYNHMSDRSAENMKKNWLSAALNIGCGENQEYTYIDFTPKIMKCLKEVSPETILQLCTELELATPKLSWDRLVVIDQQFLPDKPIELLLNLRLNHTKNIFIGTVEDEGSIMLAIFYDQDKYDWDSPMNFTLNEAFEELASISSHFSSNLQIIGEEISEFYFYGLNDSTDYSEIRHRMSSALGDYYFVCPSLRFAEVLFGDNTDNVKVYQYLNRISFDIFDFKWNQKAYHGSDLLPVFGIPLQTPNYSERQKEATKEIIEMFAHFARHGHPKAPKGQEFNAYFAITDKIVKPYYEFNEYQKSNNFGIGLKAIECDYLWNEFLDY